MSRSRAPLRRIVEILSLSALLAFTPALAEAKMGDLLGKGLGSRGSRSFTPPPATRTAPTQAAPIERSITPPPSAGQTQPGLGAARPGLGAANGGFGRGLMGGLAGGLLGAGLIGLITGHGFFGGIGGLFSIIGLLLQVALLVFLARLAFSWWRGQNPAPAGAGFARSAAPGFGGGFGLAGGGAGQAAPPRAVPLQLSGEDFPAFERLLTETQDAYSREDLAALDRLMTPEMANYFREELEGRRQKGLVNHISQVKLLQGDLSEAWREGADEYATVAMRFALVDVTLDRASGKVVAGDPTAPTQSTEVWTFRRPAGATPRMWKLSALQQAA